MFGHFLYKVCPVFWSLLIWVTCDRGEQVAGLCGVAGGVESGYWGQALRVLLPYILAHSAHRPATWREAE